MKTVIHQYNYNVSNADEAKAWKTLKADRKAAGARIFSVLDTLASGPCLLEGEVELETKHVFDNQWNTADTDNAQGWRVFDFYHGIVPNAKIKRGHWLEITDEMREVRRDTMTCGYCGHQESAAKGAVFCGECLGSEYLKLEELHLLRLLPAGERHEKRAELSDVESAHLLPLFQVEHQKMLDRKAVQKRERHEKDLANARHEHESMLWLLDHGWDTENVIYYSHKDSFTFGWRRELTYAEVQRLLEIITEFPGAYVIKGHDENGEARTWERIAEV